MLNKTLPVDIKVGIGVNTGEAVVGNMSSSTRFDYSAIGDAVNIAARLESATKEAGVEILIGETTAREEMKLNDQLYSHGEIKVKGKAKPLQVYTI
jgi:adenylate cyclase